MRDGPKKLTLAAADDDDDEEEGTHNNNAKAPPPRSLLPSILLTAAAAQYTKCILFERVCTHVLATYVSPSSPKTPSHLISSRYNIYPSIPPSFPMFMMKKAPFREIVSEWATEQRRRRQWKKRPKMKTSLARERRKIGEKTNDEVIWEKRGKNDIFVLLLRAMTVNIYIESSFCNMCVRTLL